MRDPYEDKDYQREPYLPEDKGVEHSERRLKVAFGIYLALILVGIWIDSLGFFMAITGGFFVYMLFNLGGRFRK